MDWRDLVRFSKTTVIQCVVGDWRDGDFDKPIACARGAGIEFMVRYADLLIAKTPRIASAAARSVALWLMKMGKIIRESPPCVTVR